MTMNLLIGYGNSMRSDDGIGPHVANHMSQQNIPALICQTTQQLQLEVLEDAVNYDRVILVDAHEGGEEIVYRRIKPRDFLTMSSTHHLSPELFSELAKVLYGKNLDLHVCSIRGESF